MLLSCHVLPAQNDVEHLDRIVDVYFDQIYILYMFKFM